jgi:hypothetical protein
MSCNQHLLNLCNALQVIIDLVMHSKVRHTANSCTETLHCVRLPCAVLLLLLACLSLQL